MRVIWWGVIGLIPVIAGAWLAERGANAPDAELLLLHARSRVPAAGATGFSVKETTLKWEPAKTAIIICDMWNQHWCKGATRRVGEWLRP